MFGNKDDCIRKVAERVLYKLKTEEEEKEKEERSSSSQMLQSAKCN